MNPGHELRRTVAAILAISDARQKADLARDLAADWNSGSLHRDFRIGIDLPARPARPERPQLLAPRDMPRRKVGGTPEKRSALLHALAHIELNAIDLALDLVARFDGPDLPIAFADDWVKVAGEEALHFSLLSDRLRELGCAYGDLPAHDGLWLAAMETSHDVLARIAIVPLVLEARGLDVTPATIAAFAGAGDDRSAAILSRILEDEISHVATGMRWFRYFAGERGLEPVATWRDLVARHFRGQLKPPFNEPARTQAGMEPEFYLSA